MLSRHASYLYWTGRYQERADYLARYLQVKYFSTMDSTLLDYKDFSLRSILFMTSGTIPTKEMMSNEGDVLWEIALNPESSTSIISYVNAVRDNMQGVRNLISNEIWESVNKNYHFTNNYNPEYFRTRGLYEFTHGIQENITSFHAKLDSTILHDDAWAFIKIGIEIERIYQVSRCLINTLIDIKALKKEGQSQAMENYHWLVTLSTLEATDMTRKLFRKTAQLENTCEFLISNLDFPRSISFCFDSFNSLVRKIKNSSVQLNEDKNSLEFKGSKIASYLKYLDYSEDNIDINKLLDYIQSQVMVLNDIIHKEFFD
ncbi:MAG: alpha-E domain-containing protein [Bacteroidota bacterium]